MLMSGMRNGVTNSGFSIKINECILPQTLYDANSITLFI